MWTKIQVQDRQYRSFTVYSFKHHVFGNLVNSYGVSKWIDLSKTLWVTGVQLTELKSFLSLILIEPNRLEKKAKIHRD